jgi:hypothetical protein
MHLSEVIASYADLDEELVAYAKKVEGRFLPTSEALLLTLTEDEQDMRTDEVAARHCPGFSYCMEIFLIKEIMQDLDNVSPKVELENKIERVIHYIEYDA